MSDELKPCPFCGSELVTMTEHGWNFYPTCVMGHEGTDYPDKDKAIQDWNNRPIEDELRAEIEILTSQKMEHWENRRYSGRE